VQVAFNNDRTMVTVIDAKNNKWNEKNY